MVLALVSEVGTVPERRGRPPCAPRAIASPQLMDATATGAAPRACATTTWARSISVLQAVSYDDFGGTVHAVPPMAAALERSEVGE